MHSWCVVFTFLGAVLSLRIVALVGEGELSVLEPNIAQLMTRHASRKTVVGFRDDLLKRGTRRMKHRLSGRKRLRGKLRREFAGAAGSWDSPYFKRTAQLYS